MYCLKVSFEPVTCAIYVKFQFVRCCYESIFVFVRYFDGFPEDLKFFAVAFYFRKRCSSFMRGAKLIALAVALFLVFLALGTLFAASSDTAVNNWPLSTHGLAHGPLCYFSHFLLLAAKINPNGHFHPNHVGRRPKKEDNAKLSLFTGREAKLNRVILLTLDLENPLTSYGIYLEVRRIKGFRHTKRQAIDRRVKALYAQGWLVQCGVRPAKAHFLSPLYTLTINAKAALALDKTDLNRFVRVAPEAYLQAIIDVFSICL
jgi:hypothetical protein